MKEQFVLRDSRLQSSQDDEHTRRLEEFYPRSIGSHVDKLRNFTKFVPRASIAEFLAKHEIFRRALGIQGHIIECGVFLGGGLMTWAQLSAIYEPANHYRRVVGFDTFAGVPQKGEQDETADPNEHSRVGGFKCESYEDLLECEALYDLTRAIGHIPRIELVKGDACETMEAYRKKHKHLVVALLYLDFDLYEATKKALEVFLPRMPKGAVIGFNELDNESWPGVSEAIEEVVGFQTLRIERAPFASHPSWAVLE